MFKTIAFFAGIAAAVFAAGFQVEAVQVYAEVVMKVLGF